MNAGILRVRFGGLALAAPFALFPASTSAPSFVEFDERLVSTRAGVVVVRAPVDAHGPLVAHASRRLRISGLHPVHAAARVGAPLFRELATYFDVSPLPGDPLACANVIRQAALAQHSAIVAPLPREGTWDHTVAEELAKDGQLLIVFLADAKASRSRPLAEESTFDVASELGEADKLRWLSAIAEEAQAVLPTSELHALEAWWTKARRVTPESSRQLDQLVDEERLVLGCLALAGRSLSTATLTKLLRRDVTATLGPLVDAGIVSLVDGVVSPAEAIDIVTFEQSASSEMRLAVASHLAEERENLPSDPWALGRAAELFVSAADYERADATIAKAQKVAAQTPIGTEIAARWFDKIAGPNGLDNDGGLMLRVRAAQRALHSGEAGDAQRWCQSAAILAPDDPSISLLMGRALIQLGDLVSARVCLTRAEATAQNDAELLARVEAERAEVSYLTGELDLSANHAQRAVEFTKTSSTRLAARSTLGKLLLARGSWEAADEHFAEDALVAATAGETTAELRARLNRAIALLSKGRLDEARALLERVLDDGTKLEEERARVYALSNLGLVAYRQHDYGSALQYWEQTVRFPQALRGRLATALTIANLADLRLRLGLVEHAEHAIAFGKKLTSGSTPPRCAALFKWVTAQIALARGNTELARREIESSIVDAHASGDRDCLEYAYLVSARIALEDGDLARTAQSLEQAEKVAKSLRARAELAIIRAIHLRAMGQSALDAANDALHVARSAGDEDLLSEIYALLAVLHRDAGDLLTAQAHCGRAIAVRNRVANGLPADVRAAFLAKPEIVALSRLQSSLANDVVDVDEEAPRSQRSPRNDVSTPREMVGDDPAMKNLTIAIRKVAKSNSTVLIRGESGTGKELVADALHRASDRASGPIVSVNCAALVETLLLSELFGHEKGAFTGATMRRRGRFEMAEGGTLFLDEIGDISPRTQVALLRVLQEKTFERVGGTTPLRANVRVICATHRDLRAMVDRGEFREDLYYRLRGITLEVPALRSRLGDLPKLAEHLLQRIAIERNEQPKQLSNEALDLFLRHRWPGNIRELENVLRAVSLFAEGDVITAADVIDNVDDLRVVARNVDRGPASQPPLSLRALAQSTTSVTVLPSPLSSPGDTTDDDESDGSLPDDEANATAVAYAQVRQGTVSLSDIKRQIERDCIARALMETKGNITRAAALLGMKRPRLSQLVKQYGLSAASSEGNS